MEQDTTMSHFTETSSIPYQACHVTLHDNRETSSIPYQACHVTPHDNRENSSIPYQAYHVTLHGNREKEQPQGWESKEPYTDAVFKHGHLRRGQSPCLVAAEQVQRVGVGGRDTG